MGKCIALEIAIRRTVNISFQKCNVGHIKVLFIQLYVIPVVPFRVAMAVTLLICD
jgi:hypothetical protein